MLTPTILHFFPQQTHSPQQDKPSRTLQERPFSQQKEQDSISILQEKDLAANQLYYTVFLERGLSTLGIIELGADAHARALVIGPSPLLIRN